MLTCNRWNMPWLCQCADNVTYTSNPMAAIHHTKTFWKWINTNKEEFISIYLIDKLWNWWYNKCHVLLLPSWIEIISWKQLVTAICEIITGPSFTHYEMKIRWNCFIHYEANWPNNSTTLAVQKAFRICVKTCLEELKKTWKISWPNRHQGRHLQFWLVQSVMTGWRS